MNFDELKDEVIGLLETFAEETGRDLEASAEEMAQLAALLAKTLGKSIGKPGFEEALKASRDILALEAGIAAVDEGDAIDARFRGMADALLRIGAKALALLA